MVDKYDVSLAIGANSEPFITAMQHVVEATKAGTAACAAALKNLGGVSEEVGGQVVDQQAAMASAFAEMQAQMKAAMADFVTGVKTVMQELWEKVKNDSKAAAIAVGVAFSVLGLGAIYTAYRAISASASFIKGLFTGDSYRSGDIDKLQATIAVVDQLRGQINLTREEASALAIAFDKVGVSQGDYISTSSALLASVRENGDALQELGIDTKTSGDRLADFQRIGGQAVRVLEDYAVGYDREKAAREAGLPSYAALKTALKVTAESYGIAHDEAQQFSLLIGDEVAGEMAKYSVAVAAFKHQSDLTWNGFSRAIADSVMPILGDLADFFKDGFPSIVNFTRGVVGSVVSLFHGFLLSIYAVAETVMGTLKAVGEGVVGLGKGIAKAMTGDWAGAWTAIQDGGREAAAQIGNSFNNIAARAETARNRMYMAFLGGQDGSSQTKSDTGNGKHWTPKPGAEEESLGAEKSRIAEWESELAQTKGFFQKTYELREYSKQQEKDYWDSILRNVAISGQERIAITRKVAELELEVMKKKLQQQKDLGAEAINAHEKAADDGLKMEELLADREYQLGNISKTQLITLQQQYEDRRAAIQEEAQAARITALLGDPNMDPVALQKLLDQMAEIHRAHDLRIAKLNSDAAIESKNKWEQMLAPISNAFEKSITGMIQGTLTLQKALRNIFNAILGEFISMTVKMGMKWAAMELAKTADTKKGSVLRSVLEKMGLIESSAAQVTASTTTAAAKKAEAVAVIPAEAAEAAGAAASAVAGIPIVGPALAAAAFAETMAMVMGGLAVASAAHGFDIPSGVNPMTQLHEQEMVLPAEHANTIRQLSAGGGRTGDTHLYVQAVDAASVERLFRDNGHLLARELRRQSRNFAPTNA